MGVYIPNMEKPKECGDCNFVQAFWDDKRWLFRCLVTDKIAEDCPLIEIDDELFKKAESAYVLQQIRSK